MSVIEKKGLTNVAGEPRKSFIPDAFFSRELMFVSARDCLGRLRLTALTIK